MLIWFWRNRLIFFVQWLNYDVSVKTASVDELKQRISDEWDKIDRQLIDSAIKQWSKRLAARVSARGGHIEHVL